MIYCDVVCDLACGVSCWWKGACVCDDLVAFVSVLVEEEEEGEEELQVARSELLRAGKGTWLTGPKG